MMGMGTKWSFIPISAQTGDFESRGAAEPSGGSASTRCHQIHPPTLCPVPGTTLSTRYSQGTKALPWHLPCPCLRFVPFAKPWWGGGLLSPGWGGGCHARGEDRPAAVRAEAVLAARLSQAVFWWRLCFSLPG